MERTTTEDKVRGKCHTRHMDAGCEKDAAPRTAIPTSEFCSLPGEHTVTDAAAFASLAAQAAGRTSCDARGTGRAQYPSKHKSGKRVKKNIYISYSPDAGFLERKFVVETVRQLKDNNLASDIWFDKDEHVTDSAFWFSSRMETVEKCRAAILFLSDSYFSCPVSVYECRALLERQQDGGSSPSVSCYPILYNVSPSTEIPTTLSVMLTTAVDLTTKHLRCSVAEKSSLVVGALMLRLEKHASVGHMEPGNHIASDTEVSADYHKKKICQWTPDDLQEWLFKLGINEFYRQSVAEYMVDGFLLMSVNDQDMLQHLGIDSRAVRRKVMQQIVVTLDRELRMAESWHLRARGTRPKSNCAYLIYDPADVQLAQSLKENLTKKGLCVIHHTKLGQTKDEFLQLNGPQIATATSVIVVLTLTSVTSPFVFHEVLFSDWLGKCLVTAVFSNPWSKLRPSLKAVLGECASVDFERNMYEDSLEVLVHHIKPKKMIAGIVLEQTYLDKMLDGLRPLAQLASFNDCSLQHSYPPPLYLSYQWDDQAQVDHLRQVLQAQGYKCFTDTSPTTSLHCAHSSIGRNAHHAVRVHAKNSDQHQKLRDCQVVLGCITPKYLQSDSCVKNLLLSDSLGKPVILIVLRFCPWPPEGTSVQLKKILIKHTPIDLSNDKQYKYNLSILLDRIRKVSLVK